MVDKNKQHLDVTVENGEGRLMHQVHYRLVIDHVIVESYANCTIKF